MRKLIPILFVVSIIVIFFWQFFVKGLLPIPSDTIIGLYHPFRDLYAKDYPNGIPFKNFLITDPVRQQYPWRELVISAGKRLELPLWNPYNFSGTPLLANFQSGSFYFLNILFFAMPFQIAWSLIIFLGPLLGGVFMFSYLDSLRLSRWGSLLGSISFAFCGFFVAWMEWGTITHVGLWLPLILLAIDKIFLGLQPFNSKFKIQNSKLQRKVAWQQRCFTQFKIKNYVWPIIFLFSLVSAFFAGHLQTFFYLFTFSWVYFFARWIQHGKIFKILFVFLIFNILFLILTSIQWIPTLQLIQLSARNIDRIGIDNPGWFIPWQHLIQFVAPDFFGNPTTLNYWGVWNYGEFVGYIGIISLVFAIFSVFARHDKKTLFFGTVLFVSLIFSLPTFFAKLPFILNIPFLETAQPTRLLFLITFSLAVLVALGFDYFIQSKKKDFIFSLGFVAIIFISLWVFVNTSNPTISSMNLLVAKRNLLLPTILFALFGILIPSYLFLRKHKVIATVIPIIIIGVAVFDLFRFGLKFEPFTEKTYLFPSTPTVSFLQKNLGEFRIMSTDSRILPPNFSAIYKVKSLDGYDPLYLLRYGELIAASERKKADINPPFGFNRIITPHNYDSKIIDLLGVKFVLSLSDLDSPKLKKVFQEGETRVYENRDVLPRAFFVEKFVQVYNKYEAIRSMFDQNFDFRRSAIVELTKDGVSVPPLRWKVGDAEIVHYSENTIVIDTKNTGDGFLVLTDSYYPTWHALIDGRKVDIYRVDYHFRGIVVPRGKHLVEFSQI